MARRPLTGSVRVITETEGQVTEGSYLGNRAIDIGKEKPQIAHSLEKDGETFEFWGSAQVNNALAPIKPGTYVWITYRGKVPSRNGQMHSFDIEYDDETGSEA